MTSGAPLERVFRKSSVAYVYWCVGTLIWVGIPLAVGLTQSGTVRTVFVAVALVAAARRVYRFFVLRSIRWVVRDDGVVIAGGILPWKSRAFHCPYETILEALYKRSFFGHLLNYGACRIQRAQGFISVTDQTHMHEGLALVSLVNTKLAQARRAPAVQPL